MPILPAKNKWAQQPRHFCEPKNSWLDLGLNFIQFGESNFIWFNGKILFPSIAEKVYGADYTGSRDVSLPNSITQELITTWPITTFALIKSEQVPSSSRYPAIITQSDYNNTNSQGIEIGLYGNTGVSTTTPYAIVRGGDYIQNQSTIFLSNSVTSSRVTAIAHRANNSGHRLDGFELGYAVGNIISKPTANTVKSTAFGVTSAGDKCTIILHLRFAQYLPNDILFELKRNPWQIFRSKKRISYFDLSSAANLSAAAQATASATGTIASSVEMSGASVAAATATGTVETTAPLVGTAQAIAAGGGTLDIAVLISAATQAIASATGQLSTSAFLTALSSAQASASGTASVETFLSAFAEAQTTLAGQVTTDGTLAGNASSQAATAGTLSVADFVSASAQAVSSLTGTLGVIQYLEGLASSIASTIGQITVTNDVAVTGQADSNATTTGALDVAAYISGLAQGISSTTASVTVTNFIQAAASAISSLTGIFDSAVVYSRTLTLATDSLTFSIAEESSKTLTLTNYG